MDQIAMRMKMPNALGSLQSDLEDDAAVHGDRLLC